MSSSPPMITWMQSLSEPTRARILRLLDRVELTVAEVCSTLQLPQSTVSRHLKVLGDEGWISLRREGPSNLYRMRTSELALSQRELWQVVRSQSVLEATAEQDDARLEQVLEIKRSKSAAFFSSSAEKWDRLKSDLFGSRLDAWALGAIADRRTIVGDFGCGTGAISQLLAPWVDKVIAVDSSSTMIQTAKERLRGLRNVEVRKGELSELPVENETLSLGIASLVLPYVPEPAIALREMSRTLRPNGKLLIIDMVAHDRTEYRETMGHLWLGFSQETIVEWLSACGWEEVQYQPIPPDPEAKGPGVFVATATGRGTL